MKIAHLSDLHITLLPPRWSAYFGRRLSGALNLSLLGRGEKYRDAAARGACAVAQIIEAQPDAVVFGGDATSLSEPEEFAGAIEVLAPLLDLGVPCIALPGNHDRYTRRAEVERRFERAFADWQQIGAGWETLELGGASIGFVDTARANRMIWDSRGRSLIPPARLPQVVFAHYALLNHHAAADRKWHALRREEMVRLPLRDGPGIAWCCGHLHRSFTARAGGLVQYSAGSVGGPKGHWQMIEINGDLIERVAWSAEGPGRRSKMT